MSSVSFDARKDNIRRRTIVGKVYDIAGADSLFDRTTCAGVHRLLGRMTCAAVHCLLGRTTRAAVLIVLVFAQVACTPGERRGELEDDLGRSVALERPAERVVTLAPSLTEMVYAAGGGHRLVGVGKPDDYPPAVDTLPRFSTYPVDFEAIAALRPDLALATDQVNSPRDAATLEALGIPTYFLAFGSLNDVFEGLETVGRLLGTEEQARVAADSLRMQTASIRAKTRDAGDRPDVLFIIGRETLFSFGNESYVHEMIEAAGGRSVTAELDVQAPVLSEEYVLRRQPDVIMGPWSADLDASELLAHHPTWNVLSAVQNDRIYGIEASLVQRPGPRLVRGIREMARKLHPVLFDETLTP